MDEVAVSSPGRIKMHVQRCRGATNEALPLRVLNFAEGASKVHSSFSQTLVSFTFLDFLVEAIIAIIIATFPHSFIALPTSYVKVVWVKQVKLKLF